MIILIVVFVSFILANRLIVFREYLYDAYADRDNISLTRWEHILKTVSCNPMNWNFCHKICLFLSGDFMFIVLKEKSFKYFVVIKNNINIQLFSTTVICRISLLSTDHVVFALGVTIYH